MIQFNLLPDIKLEYIKAKRMKRSVILISSVVGGSAFAIFVLLFLVVNFAQKTHLSNLQTDLDNGKKALQEKQNLSEILTIQNQLDSLPALHQQKPVATRIYSFIQQVTPQNVGISTLTVNFTEQTMRIEGGADTLATVNTFVDTLKFTTFKADPANPDGSDTESTTGTPFNDVVLFDFSITNSQTGGDVTKPAVYTIELKYDPVIFQDTKAVTLITNPQVTTRSETEKPNDIFQVRPTNGTGQ
jgi:hypothetical protein